MEPKYPEITVDLRDASKPFDIIALTMRAMMLGHASSVDQAEYKWQCLDAANAGDADRVISITGRWVRVLLR